MNLNELKANLNRLVPIFADDQLSFVVEKNSDLVLIAKFRSFAQDELEIQKLVTQYDDQQVLVETMNGNTFAYCGCVDGCSIVFKLIENKFEMVAYNEDQEIQEIDIPRMLRSGRTLQDEIKEHFAREAQIPKLKA